MSADTFDEDFFETRLEALKDTQEGIQQMSAWCLQQRTHHKKIVACWLNVLKRVRVEHRLTLFYLANDVIQNSKRKRYEFVESWATALQRATTMVRDEKVKGKVLRILSIWEQRDIYSEEYLSDLSGLLNINPPKKAQSVTVESSDDYTNGPLIANVRECVELSLATDNSFKKLPKAPNCDIELIKQQIKDKSHSDDIEKEIERYTTYAEAYSKHLQAEIRSRKAVLSNLDTAIKFYANQRGEVKVVVSAYKNFGSRIKLVKKKLDEITPNLPSPIPSPDINAPSPEPDADLQLPDDQTPISINLFKNSINGYSSYLDGKLPFDINDFKRDDTSNKSSHPIEVIGSRSDDESYSSSTEYYKPEPITAFSSSTNISIPGLNPLPVPPVESGYTSLARSAQQYGGLLPPPATTLFGGNNGLHHDYNTSYTPDSGYHGSGGAGGAVSSNSIMGGQPLMPPPPMPNLLDNASGGNGISGVSRTPNNGSEDFNSTWNMNLSWTSVDNSNLSNSSYTRDSIDTPVSPPHFEREASSGGGATIEYSEHHTSNVLVSQQDVDHRRLAFDVPSGDLGVKLGLSKEKSRQLDIDHRNLISLTGSPGGNDDKKSWLSQDPNFLENASGDVDYRALPVMALDSADLSSKHGLMAPPPPSLQKKTNSPQKSNASSSSDKDDAGSARYDPSDMVIDMDMSDEDLDDILREVNEQQSDQLDSSQQSIASGDGLQIDLSKDHIDDEALGAAAGGRPALLETPPEYIPQPVWNSSQMGQAPMPSYEPQNIGMNMEMQQQEMWNQNNWHNDNNGRGCNNAGVPPPPRPPFPLPFNNFPMNSNMRGGRGGGAPGWGNSPQQNQFRNDRFPRPPRGGGGHAGSPYYNRGGRGGGGGGGGGGMRGGFRGKFRGNPAWI